MGLHQTEITASQQASKHVRERVWRPEAAKALVALTESERASRALQVRVHALESEASHKDAVIRALQDDLADAHARILSQAKIICERSDEDLMGGSEASKRPVKEIIAEVLRDYPGVTWQDIISVRRVRAWVQPRKACMIAVYTERDDLPAGKIGQIFKRDRTTVLYAVGTVKKGRDHV